MQENQCKVAAVQRRTQGFARSVWSASSLLALAKGVGRSESGSKLRALQTLRAVRLRHRQRRAPATGRDFSRALGAVVGKLPRWKRSRLSSPTFCRRTRLSCSEPPCSAQQLDRKSTRLNSSHLGIS